MKRFFYTEDMVQYIRDNVHSKSNIRIAEELSEMYEHQFTGKDIHSALKRYGIKRENPQAGGRLRSQEMIDKYVPPDVAAYIKDNHVGIGQKKMIEIIKEKFGIEYSHPYMKYYYRKMGYCSGLTGHFSADDPPS